jgi:hypothetical protein
MPSGKEGYLEGSLKVGTAIPCNNIFILLRLTIKNPEAILARSALIAVAEQHFYVRHMSSSFPPGNGSISPSAEVLKIPLLLIKYFQTHQ